MKRFTLDASGLLRYFVDALPSGADDVFRAAFDGEVRITVPAIAAAESMYIAANRTEIAGLPFDGTPQDVVDVLESDAPIDLDPLDLPILAEMTNWQGVFPRQLHDALIVATHVANETEAVVTSDAEIADVVPTVWN